MSTFDEALEDIKKAKSVLDTPQEVVAEIKHPDPTKHKYISFAKSALRIIAGGMLFVGQLEVAGGLFVVAELLGIAEELV